MSSYITIANLSLRATGDTRPIALTLTTPGGDPVDITGYNFALAVNADENPADPGATNVLDLTGEIVDAAAGSFRFVLDQPAADALVVLPNSAAYWFEVRAVDGNGDSGAIMKGRLPVTGSLAP